MRPSIILRKLRDNQPVLVTSLHLPAPSLFELASLMGFDGLWLDMEHHAHSMELAEGLLRAARVGRSDMLVRPAKGEFMRMGRMLEAGAQGILYPRCDNAAEAAEVVRWAKFPPLGRRGVDGGNADMPYSSTSLAQYVKEANEQTFIVIQIEEDAAIEHVEEIAAVKGVDVIFLGPGDFSVHGGYPGEFEHPKIMQATERIAAAARHSGKHWGRPASTLDQAREFLAMGASLISYMSDFGLLKLNYERIQREFGELGFEFENQFVGQVAAEHISGMPHFRSRKGPTVSKEY